MDLQATHHTNEIAQSQAFSNVAPVKYWMHTNMLTVNGVRMSKSAGNGFLPNELFTGDHPLLERGYSPMTVRFFMAQAHYRSTLDFSNEALQAAEKGLKRLMLTYETLKKIKAETTSSIDISKLHQDCYNAMDDDFNSPMVVSTLFEAVRIINSANDGKEKLTQQDIDLLKKLFDVFAFEILGLKAESSESGSSSEEGLMDLILTLRQNAKANKDYATSDQIRDALSKIGISVKDTKEGATWNKE
jgi:cysteinyl-tRNA synthetase